MHFDQNFTLVSMAQTASPYLLSFGVKLPVCKPHFFWTFLEQLKNCDLCRPFSLRVFKLQGMTIPPVDSKFYADQGNGVIFSIGITLVVISPVPVNSTFCNFPIFQFWPLFNLIFHPKDVDFTKIHFWQGIFKIFSAFRIWNPFFRSYHG